MCRNSGGAPERASHRTGAKPRPMLQASGGSERNRRAVQDIRRNHGGDKETSCELSKMTSPTVQLAQEATPVLRAEAPISGTTYCQIGVKLCYSWLFRAEESDTIVNKIWAQNGSVAVVPAWLAGCYGSGEDGSCSRPSPMAQSDLGRVCFGPTQSHCVSCHRDDRACLAHTLRWISNCATPVSGMSWNTRTATHYV